MGEIIFEPSENLIISHVIKMEITNWRALLVDHRNKVLKVTLEDCDEALIRGITLDEFHELNYCNKEATKTFELGNCWLVCRRCDGKGLTDWVTNTMSRPKTMLFKLPYDRNPHGEIISLEYPSYPTLDFYISTPKKEKSQEFCSHCYGCGLQRVNQFKVLKRFTIENC